MDLFCRTHLATGHERRAGGTFVGEGPRPERGVAPSSSAGCTPVTPGKPCTGRRALGLPLERPKSITPEYIEETFKKA